MTTPASGELPEYSVPATNNILEAWEAEAAAFHLVSGYLRPGKDYPSSVSWDEYESKRAWSAWCGGRKWERANPSHEAGEVTDAMVNTACAAWNGSLARRNSNHGDSIAMREAIQAALSAAKATGER